MTATCLHSGCDAVSKLERIRQCNGDSNSENFRTGSILQRTSLASGVTEQAWLPLAIAKLAFRDAVVHMKCPRRLQYRDALQVGQVQCDALTRRDETFQQGMTPYRLKDQENLLQRGPLHGFFVFPCSRLPGLRRLSAEGSHL